MKLKHYFIVPAVLALAACTRPVVPPTTVHVEAPALRDYFSTLAPELAHSAVSQVKVCDFSFASRNVPQNLSYVFVEFDNGMRYSVKLETSSGARFGTDCRYVFSKVSSRAGVPQTFQYFVRRDIAENSWFTDGVKKELGLVAEAVAEALSVQKSGATPQQSWGIVEQAD